MRNFAVDLWFKSQPSNDDPNRTEYFDSLEEMDGFPNQLGDDVARWASFQKKKDADEDNWKNDWDSRSKAGKW